ncbi:MAG: type I-C CRISPR-associated protein Cas7/Csd2 [Victivallaceae bacterium]|nr:type I-C CRISPR-associated protein Cas7/Csd2 [Victivallaceae bacterium]MDD4180272.1 type I-C CRISPR-associated protein Cas7/Csd2 [Victivallaceae bacterium]
MSLKNKIDFAVVFSVKHANPNGDPLNGNRPRTTFDGTGEVSDVCLKRKIRDRLMERKIGVLVQSDDRKTDEYGSLKSRADATVKAKDKKTYTAEACKAWYDVRAFGQVFAFKKGKETDGVSIGIRGPVSIHPAFTTDKVDVTSTQITKSVNSEDSEKKGSDTMGMKHRIDKGTYVFYGSISPQLASTTGFSDEDAALLKDILPKMFENDASSARPDGSMRVLKVIWWQHSCFNGDTSSARVHESLKVDNDGNIELVKGDKIPEPEIIEGF